MLYHVKNLTHCTFTKQIFCSIFVFDLKEYIKPSFPILFPELVGGKGLSEANFPFDVNRVCGNFLFRFFV